MKFRTTERGFHYYEFTDRYGCECSLQESSLATEAAIWFGIDKLSPQYTNSGASYRMHLTAKQVKRLLPVLKYFAENGLVPTPKQLKEDK